MHRRWQMVNAVSIGCGIIPDVHLETSSGFKCALSVCPDFCRSHLYSSSLFFWVFFLSHVGICVPNTFPFLCMDCPFPGLQLPCWTRSQIHLPGRKWQPNTSLFNTLLVEEAETLERLVWKWEWCHLLPISGVQSIHLSQTRWSMWLPYSSEYSGKMHLGEVLSGLGCAFSVVLS